MGIIFLIVSILFFVSIFLTFRIFDYYKINNPQAIIINYAIASLVSYFFYKGDIPLSTVSTLDWFPYSAVLGVLFMLSFLLFAISTQKAGIAITSVASKMSVLIPVFLGAYLYEYETLNTVKIVGLILSIVSFYLIFKKEKTEEFDIRKIILPFFIFLFSGANDSLLKYIREMFFKSSEINLDHEILFMGILFSFSFISGLIILGTITIAKKEKFEFKTIIAGTILGVINFFSVLTMFKAMGHFESSFFFPVFNVSIVGLSTLIGIILFKEKLSKTNKIGTVLALITILLLALN
ncbi:MAG: EamA/RhaT family transporter [Bacteroidetes bacterium]|nr:MAG: EamA/RhaT family transporter [Bacteroidota bacterium]